MGRSARFCPGAAFKYARVSFRILLNVGDALAERIAVLNRLCIPERQRV